MQLHGLELPLLLQQPEPQSHHLVLPAYLFHQRPPIRIGQQGPVGSCVPQGLRRHAAEFNTAAGRIKGGSDPPPEASL